MTMNRLVSPTGTRKLIAWRCHRGCDAGVNWNESRTVAVCKLCGEKSKRRPENIVDKNRDHGGKAISEYDPYND